MQPTEIQVKSENWTKEEEKTQKKESEMSLIVLVIPQLLLCSKNDLILPKDDLLCLLRLRCFDNH